MTDRQVTRRNPAPYFNRKTVRARRESLGLSRTEVAYFAGTSEAVLAKVERGKRGVSANLGGRIYRALGLPIEPGGEIVPPRRSVVMAVEAESAAQTAAEAALVAAEAAQVAARAAADAAATATATVRDAIGGGE